MVLRGHSNLVSIKIKFKKFLEITAKQKKRKLSAKTVSRLGKWEHKVIGKRSWQKSLLKVHKIENFFDSDLGICVISLIVMSQY
jgi:hypothetical protein